MAVVHAGKASVWINGVDITSHVRDITIRAHVGSLVETQVTLIGETTFDYDALHNMQVRIGKAPTTSSGPQRGIRLRDE